MPCFLIKMIKAAYSNNRSQLKVPLVLWPLLPSASAVRRQPAWSRALFRSQKTSPLSYSASTGFSDTFAKNSFAISKILTISVYANFLLPV